jgi:hypothetical protein
MGWAGKKNGDLLTIAEGAFDALITVDQGMSYQQNMRDRTLSILVIEALSNRIEDLANKVPGAKEALKSLEPGQIIRV